MAENQTLLALDIGNTNVVLGIFRNGELIIRRRLATRSGRTADEAGILVKMLCRDGGVDPEQINAVAIASVAPKIGMVYGEMSRSFLDCEPYFIDGEAPGFVNRVRDPLTVGADRVCSSVAGYERHGGPLLILDFGTAITIDVIDSEGGYLGGVILPGLETSIETLKRVTALLPSVRLKMPDSAIGTTTESCIQVGIVRGAVAAIRGLITDIREELGVTKVRVIATGGFAPVITKHLPEVSETVPDLVLEGIRLVYQRSRE